MALSKKDALPNKEGYIPIKTIYILQGQPNRFGKPFNIHGISFNADGRGSTTSYNDKEFLLKKGGFKEITKKYWEAKAKVWDKLVKAESSGKKGKPEPELEIEPEPEPEKEDEAEKKKGK